MKQSPMSHCKHVLLGGLAALALAACRGGISESPPVHFVLDMDFQPKIKAQSESHFEGWKDHRGQRLPVKDTIARGSLPADLKLNPDPLHPGKNLDGSYIAQNPLPVTAASLARGRERFEIFCSPCHGLTGRGGNKDLAHGIVGRRWSVVIPSFHEQPGADEATNRVAKQADGVFFETISLGKTTMPSYGERIPVEDRWRIIQYVRVLQTLGKQQ
jgi:hypothetical protein